MSRYQIVNHEQLKDFLQKYNWSYDDAKKTINKEFMFDDFKQAFAFMSYVALWSESYNHHPNWSNVYRHVYISLTTHDINDLSHLDILLAKKIEEYHHGIT